MKNEKTTTITKPATTKKNTGKKPTTSSNGGKDTMNNPMNPPATTNGEVVVYSKEFLQNFKKHENAVKSGFVKAGKSFWEVALNLHWIHANEAYKAGGRENIYDYGRETFDIARGTVHNYIAIVERFCHPCTESDMMTLREEYTAYSPTQLALLAPLTDEAIAAADIKPTMSTREIKRKITAAISDKEEEKAIDVVLDEPVENDKEEAADEKDDTRRTAPDPVRQVLISMIGSDDYLKHEESMLELLHNLLTKKPNARVEISYYVENTSADGLRS